MIGIYCITNKLDNKVYIGSSNDITHRIAVHKYQLRKNIHQNDHLQNSWNKYGKDNFIFSVIEILDNSNDLLVREKYWIDLYKENIYNICLNPEVTNLGVSRSDSFKERASETMKMVWDKRRKGIDVTRKTIEKTKNYASKTFHGIFVSPDGNEHKNIKNLMEFSKKYNLNPHGMYDLYYGYQNSHRGWTFIKYNNLEEL